MCHFEEKGRISDNCVLFQDIMSRTPVLWRPMIVEKNLKVSSFLFLKWDSYQKWNVLKNHMLFDFILFQFSIQHCS